MGKYANYLAELESDTYEQLEPRMKSRKAKRSRAEIVSELVEQVDDTRAGFNPTFIGKKHERVWIETYLSGFYEDHLISDVLRLVKGGKEATVYCCQAGPEIGNDLIAAKVYRPRMFRNLRNDSLYRMGRQSLDVEGKAVRGAREHRAMEKRTGFGQELLHTAWLANEFQTLDRLYKAEANVPKPFAQSDNAILMEYMGEVGDPAPALHNIRLNADEAQPLFEHTMHNIELMLANNCIHADLSAHNILYWDGEITIIDFPQAVNPYTHPEAFALFARDVTRVCQYFARYGVTVSAAELAKELWDRYIQSE